jgi:hypothetical protein
MNFARYVFIGAGVWGIAVLIPLYWLVDITGRLYPSPAQYPQFFYGFLSVAFAWQLAFLLIGSNPVRYRPYMLAALVEKFGYVFTLIVLYAQGRIPAVDAQAAVPDGVLGLLFVLAFMNTPERHDR